MLEGIPIPVTTTEEFTELAGQFIKSKAAQEAMRLMLEYPGAKVLASSLAGYLISTLCTAADVDDMPLSMAAAVILCVMVAITGTEEFHQEGMTLGGEAVSA